MIVCICNNVNEKTIEEIVDQKALKCISELQKEISICNQCKNCSATITEIIQCVELKKE